MWTGLGPAWGKVRMYTRQWPQPWLSSPSPHSWQAPGGTSRGAHQEWILDFLPPPTLLPFCLLPPSQGRARDQATFWLGRWERKMEWPVSGAQVMVPVPFLGGSPGLLC